MKMKLISAAAVCSLMLALSGHTLPASSSTNPGAATEEILAIERARNDAILRGDSAALAAMTSDDYTFITIRGELRTKAEIVQGFASGAFKYDSREISDLRVRIYGDSAVVTGRATQKGTENHRDYSGAYRFTRVYVRHGRGWMSVALQTTLEAQ